MKKIISSILIVLTILQVFAPFSVGLNKAEAAGNLNFVATTSKKDSTITVSVAGSIKTEETKTYISGALVTLSDGKTTQQKKLDLYGNYLNLNNQAVFSNIDASSTYKITVKTRLLTTGTKKVVNGRTIVTPLNQNIDLWDMTTEQYNDLIKKSNLEEQQLPITEVAGNAKDGVQSFQRSEPSKNDTQKTPSTLPACAIGPVGEGGGTVIGCLAQGLYYLLFVPTSFLFGLTGKALDFTLMYSISDASYRSTFVTEGWGIVRDFCNMFFIFVLLYIAFGTILNLHGVKTKEMIINVVIIGVLLNFSLFATQVIIDASNILTRVFYNQNTIATGAATKDKEGNIVYINNSLGDLGELKLSEAIVSKVDPQVLVINATKINQIPIRGKTTDEAPTTEGGLTTGSYILVILLSSAINIFGMVVFFSCAIIFVSRVVGLWLAMILAPIAFFSYTVPALQGIKMIGWKHWWPETLKLAFLAPVFAFFMYIIVGFMNKGLDVINADSKTGLSFVIAVMVPFIFIMVLLMKAKDMAKDMSGEMGQSITNGISAAGGIALGAAAGGAALLGRKVLGAGIAAASRTEGAMKYSTEKVAFNKKFEAWEQGGRVGAAPTWSAHAKQNGVNRWNPATVIGGKLNQKQVEVGTIDLARHKQDETKKASGLEGVDNENLSGENIKTMENKYKQSEGGNVESQYKKGVDAKGKVLSMTDTRGNRYTGENDFKARNRQRIINDIHRAPAPGDVDLYTGELTDAGKKKVEDKLNQELNTVIKTNVDIKLKADFEKMMKEASTHVNPVTRSFSGANKNSYDIRKISDMTTDKRESFLTKGGVGLAALIATGVRSGIRGSGFGNSQLKVEGDFMKDLGTTISDSLKSMKINVNIKGVGGNKSSADSHGGGH